MDMKQSHYTGPIEPGMGFIWEPTILTARALVIVSKIDGDKIHTVGSFRKVYEPGTITWNDESRFREAVIRCDAIDDPRIPQLFGGDREPTAEDLRDFLHPA